MGRLQHDMKVVGHDGECVNAPGTPDGGSTEVVHEPIAVDVIAHDILTAVAAGHNVVDGIRVLEPQTSWHPVHTNRLSGGLQEKT
jgi:hypothetical protein